MSKNDYGFTPLIFNVNEFLMGFIAFVFSMMRPRPQAHAAAFVQMILAFLQATQIDANFAAKFMMQIKKSFCARENSLCKSCMNTLLMRGEKRKHSALSRQHPVLGTVWV